jgi:dihydroflavonol-4-reductase
VRILVTGASGLLGNNIARLAVERNMLVASLSRTPKSSLAFDGMKIEAYQADLSDRASLNKVFENSFDVVIHCAASIHIGWKFLDEHMQVNREGTRTLLEEAGKRKIKFIHVSTVNTLPVGSKHTPANEDTAGDRQVPCTYVQTKRAAEQLATQAAAAGQDVVIVHPGFMLGPNDWKPSSGRMIQALQGFAPLAPAGGCTVCDPRDVANAILNAIDRGVAGRHYILGGENITYLDLWRRICSGLGKRGPWTHLRSLGQFVLSRVGDTVSRFIESELDINSAGIEMTSQFHWYSSQRAMNELGYQPRPAEESIQDAIEWLRENNMLRQTGR